MARKFFSFDNDGSRTPNRKLRRGKVSYKHDAAPNTTYYPAVDSTNKIIIVTDSNHWRGRSTATATPIFFAAAGNSISDLVNLVNDLRREKGLSTISTLADALAYCEAQNFVIMQNNEVWAPVLSDMMFCIDAAFAASYPGTGTTVYNIGNGSSNASLSGAVKSGDAFYFQGQGEVDGDPTGDRIDLPSALFTTNPANRPNGTTYEFWIKTNGEQSMSILWGAGTINHLELRGSMDNSYWRTEATTQNGYSFGSGYNPGGTPIGTWCHFVLVFDESNATRAVRWYKNGVLFHTGNMSSGNNPTGEYFSPSSFGRATGSSAFLYANSFKGWMSRLATWNRALTQSEITTLYEVSKLRHGH